MHYAKYFISTTLISTVIAFIVYLLNVSRPNSPAAASVKRCSWTKQTKSALPAPENPPWMSLLSNYSATIQSHQNLYVWVTRAHQSRLGNRLSKYGALFGIAWQNRRIPLWPPSIYKSNQYDINKFFNLRIPMDNNNEIVQSPSGNFLTRTERAAIAYDKRFEQLAKRNITLNAYLISYKYFLNVEDQLRIDLTFKPEILKEARDWLEKNTPSTWLGKQFVRVVVHVRRTDHVTARQVKNGWLLPTAEYFQRSFAYFTDCIERVQFVVLSDDPTWCKEHLNATHDVICSLGHSPIVDMAIASLCDHAIITIGTYGWWAAWFANGITITQKALARPRSKLLRQLSIADYYKPEWISV